MWALEYSMLNKYVSNIKSIPTYHQISAIALYTFILLIRCAWFVSGIAAVYYLRFDILFLICNIYCAFSFITGMLVFGYMSDDNYRVCNSVTICIASLWITWYLVCMVLIYIDIYYRNSLNIALSLVYFLIEYVLILISAIYFLIIMIKLCLNIYFFQKSEATICIRNNNMLYTKNNTLINPEKYYDEKSCAICLDEYSDTEKILVLKCGHHYHSGCCAKWLKIRSECPNCRQTLIIDV